MTADELAGAVVHRHLGDLDSATAFEVTEAVAATIRLVERAAEDRGRKDMKGWCAKLVEDKAEELDARNWDGNYTDGIIELRSIAGDIRALPDAPADRGAAP